MRVYRDDQKFLQFRINAVLWGIVAALLAIQAVLLSALPLARWVHAHAGTVTG